MYDVVQGSFLEANNKTHAALTEKGYDTRYAYALNQCHASPDSMLQDLPNTLVWAWSDWGKTNETTLPKTKIPLQLIVRQACGGCVFLFLL